MGATIIDDHQSAQNFNEDLNNNNINKKNNGKYSLRKRQKRNEIFNDLSDDGFNNNIEKNIVDTTNNIKVDDYVNPKTVKTKNGKIKKDKPKSKPAPLSKYRRKTANARERTRMREINSAFENLRKCVPLSIAAGYPSQPSPSSSSSSSSSSSASNNEKLTKITTLRLAMQYIKTLNDCLTSNDSNFSNRLIKNFNIPINHNNNNNNSCDVQIDSTIQNSNYSNNKNNILKLKKPIPLAEYKQKVKVNKRIPKSIISSPSSLSSTSSTLSSSMDNDYYNNNTNKFIQSDLSSLLIDSDCESITHFSEHSLSPMCHDHIRTFNISTDNDIELGLLLESDGESLQLSEPCLSPLAPLDGLSPFGDLISSNFNEQNCLEMYLS